MRYERLAEFYARLEATTKRLEMTSIVVELLRETDAAELPLVVYLTQGKVRPDFEGIELGLADRLVQRALAEGWNVPLDRVEGIYRRTGDLGEAAEEILRKGVPRRDVTLFSFGPEAAAPEPEPSVVDVHTVLMEIAHTAGEGSVDRKKALLGKLLSRLSRDPLAAKYLVRTVNGKLRLGVADQTLLDAFAFAYLWSDPAGASVVSLADLEDEGKDALRAAKADLERAYNVSSDLGAVAAAARNGPQALRDLRLTVGVPLRAMLAERLPTAGEILERMGGRAAVEWKYDGLRIQAHRDGAGAIRFFSRRLEDITAQYPDVARALDGAFEGRTFIVEGEVVATDADTGEIRPFQEIAQRRGRKHGIEELAKEIPATPFLFDCLLVDDEDLTGQPLERRRAVLTSRFREGAGVRFTRYEEVGEVAALERFFDEAVAEGAEGVMVKALDAPYRAGARGFAWIKFKRDYQAHVSDTVDLVAIGALAGRGRRAGTWGALLMGAYDPEQDVFESVCKLGSGFDDATLERLPGLLTPFSHPGGPHPRTRPGLECDAWFAPGLVLEVKAFEISLSPTHTAARDALRPGHGLALRFPRFTGRFRDDKRPEDATTTGELLSLYKAQRSANPTTPTPDDA